MKIIRLLFLGVILLPLYSYSQEALLHPGRLWTMVNINCQPWGNSYTSHYIKLGGDTVIDGTAYQKLDYSTDETQSTWIEYGGYLRETPDGKVYYKRIGINEGLVYDFGATVGDTVHVLNTELLPEPLQMVVILEDSIFLEDGWHRMMVLEDEDYPGEETWIEGVGSLSGLQKSCLNAFGSACGDYDLLCTSDYDIDVYISTEYPSCWYVTTRIDNDLRVDELKVYPNPVENTLTIEGDFLRSGEAFEIRLSDLTGRIVLQEKQSYPQIDLGNLNEGIYFLQIQTASALYFARIFKY